MSGRTIAIVLAFACTALLAGCSGASSAKRLGDEGKRSAEVQKELRDRVIYLQSDR